MPTSEGRSPSKLLITVGGGALAAVAAAYLLYVLPPERVLGKPASQSMAGSLPKHGVGGAGSPPLHEGGVPQLQTSPGVQTATAAPANAGSRSATVETETRGAPRPTWVELVAAGKPLVFPTINTAVSVTFRETLGSQYAEFIVDSPGKESLRFG